MTSGTNSINKYSPLEPARSASSHNESVDPFTLDQFGKAIAKVGTKQCLSNDVREI